MSSIVECLILEAKKKSLCSYNYHLLNFLFRILFEISDFFNGLSVSYKNEPFILNCYEVSLKSQKHIVMSNFFLSLSSNYVETLFGVIQLKIFQSNCGDFLLSSKG